MCEHEVPPFLPSTNHTKAQSWPITTNSRGAGSKLGEQQGMGMNKVSEGKRACVGAAKALDNQHGIHQ